MKPVLEVSALATAPAASVEAPPQDTGMVITLAALAAVAGSVIGAIATAGLAVLPVLRQKFPKQMNETQLDDYAEKLFSLIAAVHPLLTQLSDDDQQRVKQDLKDPRTAKDLILASPEAVIQKLGG